MILDRVHIAVAARDHDAVFDIVETLHGHKDGRGRQGDALEDGGAARIHDQHLRGVGGAMGRMKKAKKEKAGIGRDTIRIGGLFLENHPKHLEYHQKLQA